MLIILTSLTLEQKLFSILFVLTRLVRMISTTWPPFMNTVYKATRLGASQFVGLICSRERENFKSRIDYLIVGDPWTLPFIDLKKENTSWTSDVHRWFESQWSAKITFSLYILLEWSINCVLNYVYYNTYISASSFSPYSCPFVASGRSWAWVPPRASTIVRNNWYDHAKGR